MEFKPKDTSFASMDTEVCPIISTFCNLFRDKILIIYYLSGWLVCGFLGVGCGFFWFGFAVFSSLIISIDDHLPDAELRGTRSAFLACPGPCCIPLPSLQASWLRSAAAYTPNLRLEEFLCPQETLCRLPSGL